MLRGVPVGCCCIADLSARKPVLCNRQAHSADAKLPHLDSACWAPLGAVNILTIPVDPKAIVRRMCGCLLSCCLQTEPVICPCAMLRYTVVRGISQSQPDAHETRPMP